MYMCLFTKNTQCFRRFLEDSIRILLLPFLIELDAKLHEEVISYEYHIYISFIHMQLMLDQLHDRVSSSHSIPFEEKLSYVRNYKMGAEDASATKKNPRPTISRLKREREQRGWTQSELAERIGTTQVNISRWEKSVTFPSPFYRQKLGELFEKSIQELGFIPQINEERNEEVSPISDTDAHTSTPLIPSNPPLPIWNVPHRRNPFFTGREEILVHLHDALRSNQTAALTQAQAISGLGGIGKTQIAVEYAYRYRDYYQAIFWMNASSRDALSADFVILAALLDLPEQHEQDQDIVVRAVKRWLTTQPHWLLILDNVDNLEMMVDFLPVHSRGDVLLTTRLQALGTTAQSIEVEKMGLDEGVKFLLRRTKVLVPGASPNQAMEEQQAQQTQATEIVTSLDGLPLALDQAGAYIEETRCGLSQYLNLYGTRRKELLLRRGRFPIDHPDSVAATWSLSFQQVEQESQAAADLLHLLAFLDPEAIPEEIITLGAAELGPALGAAASDPLQVDSIIELLLRYSLIRRTPEVKFLSIHRLVQAVLKDGMERDTQRIWAERSIRAVNRAFPNVELQTWERCQRCLPHAQICAASSEEYELAFPEAARLFNEAASYLIAYARYQQAESLLLKALAVRRKVLEAKHPDTARTLNDLGEVYRKQSRYQDAEILLQEALAIRQQALGEVHPDVAQTLHNLANLYRTWGAYAKAEPFYLQALHIRETTSGIDSPLVAQSYFGLARLYYSQEKYQKAEKLCEQALYIQEQHSGNNLPMIASTLTMLAKIYQGQNKLDQAEEINMRALRIRKAISGENHPQVATIANSLIEIYHAEGKYREAEPLIARSLRIHEQSLGSEHPYMAYSLSNRAENFFLQGDHFQAESYYQKALTIREQNLGFNHPHTASTYYHLARLYVALERYEEAESLYCKTLSIREQAFGLEHPVVVSTLEQYSTLLRKLEREREACELEARIQAIKAK
jgi:tetratricopeptide (TPR) repeat protein/DNA-binding transcriptional regulator YiaG